MDEVEAVSATLAVAINAYFVADYQGVEAMIEKSLGHGLFEMFSIGSSNHKYLADDAARPEGPNIGIEGEHLTISFLSMNRSSLSIRLCESIAKHIPNFRGELLVVDNGSVEPEIDALICYLKTMRCRWRLVRLGENFGVAGGRNKTMAEVKTEWVMSLDNDIYLLKNPIPELQQDIAQLGCHFMSPTVLNSDENTTWINGGNIYLEHAGDGLVIGGGSCYMEHVPDSGSMPFTCTFMSGACGVFRVASFKMLGGYDDGMFVGFEDTEFSLRIWRAGMKIGASNVAAFVHDHPAPAKNDDVDYERARFSRERLLKAAKYFEAKHGFKVWTVGVDGWLDKREEELGISANKNTERFYAAQPQSTGSRKRRIALMVDSFDWALDNVAKQLHSHLKNEFELHIYATNCMPHPAIALSIAKDFDLVHFLWREPLFNLLTSVQDDYVNVMFGGWRGFWDMIPHGLKITYTIFDHLYLKDGKPEVYSWCLTNPRVSGITVSSLKLYEIYRNATTFGDQIYLTQDGVDLNMFTPRNIGRLNSANRSRPLRVGWVGNSAFGHWKDNGSEDLKGFHSVVKPSIELARAKGLRIEEVYADRQSGFIPHSQMPEYYSKIDVLICASLSEGTPNPVLEAMACGVPVISTDVGIVPEIFGPCQKEFILAGRSAANLADRIVNLAREPSLLVTLSQENIAMIRGWSWDVRTRAYGDFFRTILAGVENDLTMSCKT